MFNSVYILCTLYRSKNNIRWIDSMHNLHQTEKYKAHSIDPDEISHSVVPRQGLQCLFWESSILAQAATEESATYNLQQTAMSYFAAFSKNNNS